MCIFRSGYVSVKRARLRSVASISARRVDGEEVVEIKIDDRLQCFAGSAVAQGFREGIEPGGVLGLPISTVTKSCGGSASIA